MLKRTLLLFIISIFAFSAGFSQDSLLVTISGKVTDSGNGLPVPNLMVVNKRTQQGYFGDNGGVYTIAIRKGDELIYAATGYTTIHKLISIQVGEKNKLVDVTMNRLSIDLKPVEIFTERDLREIQEDIEKLGYDRSDYMISGVDAVSSPITYLYQQFSRREKNKRWVAEMENNDRRRDLLKELFRKYVDNNIISLEESQFDSFIDFCHVNDHFLQTSTQYEFILYIKKRWEVYEAINDMY